MRSVRTLYYNILIKCLTIGISTEYFSQFHHGAADKKGCFIGMQCTRAL